MSESRAQSAMWQLSRGGCESRLWGSPVQIHIPPLLLCLNRQSSVGDSISSSGKWKLIVPNSGSHLRWGFKSVYISYL
jgi:hypothetical protein